MAEDLKANINAFFGNRKKRKKRGMNVRDDIVRVREAFGGSKADIQRALGDKSLRNAKK